MDGPVTRSSAVMDALRRFISTENASAKLLLIATALALVWVNSPFADLYGSVWGTELPVSLGGHISDLHHLVNDGLMTLFFFVVGLEIKREVTVGELKGIRTAALPAIAAVGGMVVPALIYLSITAGTGETRGWGIPIATDIAFAVAVVSVFGSRLPSGLKVFLLSLAIVDDIGAIAVIALVYSSGVKFTWIVALFVVAAFTTAISQGRAVRPPVIALLGVTAWVCTVFSGIHPTIAGVLFAFTLSTDDDEGPSIEDRMHPLTGLVIIPLFALANAGVAIVPSELWGTLTSSPGSAIVLGLVGGKFVGITLFTWLGIKTRLGKLPDGVRASHVAGAAMAAGIGFTVALFVAGLAFAASELVDAAKLAVFTASLIAALLASVMLHLSSRRRES